MPLEYSFVPISSTPHSSTRDRKDNDDSSSTSVLLFLFVFFIFLDVLDYFSRVMM